MVTDSGSGIDVPADALLASRPLHPDIAPDPALPDATRLWAALQNVSGGAWGGCVYDTDRILEKLKNND